MNAVFQKYNLSALRSPPDRRVVRTAPHWHRSRTHRGLCPLARETCNLSTFSIYVNPAPISLVHNIQHMQMYYIDQVTCEDDISLPGNRIFQLLVDVLNRIQLRMRNCACDSTLPGNLIFYLLVECPKY